MLLPGSTAPPTSRSLPLPGLSEVTIVQAAPSQCSTSVAVAAPVVAVEYPNAHALVAEIAFTPMSTLWLVPRFGLETTDQEVPSQCSISVERVVPVPVSV